MKKTTAILAFLAFSTSIFSQNDRQIVDKIVASVGQEVVFLSEVEEQFSFAKTRQSEVPDEYRCAIAQELIIQKLLVNQARIDSVLVTEDEVAQQVEARFDRIVQQMGGDESRFEEFYGVPISVMRGQIEGDMRNQLVAEKMQRQIIENVKITPKEVQKFFSEIPKDSLPYFNSEVEIREIVLRPKVNSVEKKKAFDEAVELRKRIVEGKEDFGLLAKKHSDDPGSGLANGDLGFAKRGTYVPEFEAAVYNLEKDQVSEVTESPFGFHIIQLIERRGNSVHARHILVKPTITQADLKLASDKLDSVRTLISDKKMTFSEAVKKFGNKNEQSFSNDGRVTNPRSGTNEFELADLDTDIYFAVDGLETGKITKPIEFKGDDGERFFRIIELSSRSKPHKANLKQDYNKISKAALEQKKGTWMATWMEEKSKTTFIDIERQFEGCPNLAGIENTAGAN